MGNIISFNHTVKINDDSLAMSNGLTDVLIDYLLLSGSELAETDSESMWIAGIEIMIVSEGLQYAAGIPRAVYLSAQFHLGIFVIIGLIARRENPLII